MFGMAIKPISETLREAIENDPSSQSSISAEADVDPGSVSRLLSGQRAPTIYTVDRLCRALQLELKPARPTRKPAARQKRKRGG
jgi:transcriptional regulator with XRE-family HTH domain